MTVADPFTARIDVAVVNVMLDPDGARRGTRLHAASIANATVGMTKRAASCLRDIMKTLTILIPMYLAGQGRANLGKSERGYAMAALLVAIAVMAIVMAAAMPVWKQMATREKEEELVFRGEQIAHSIGMFQRRYANAYPPNLDVLVQQRFLRKKYKDPIANSDFVPIPQGQTAAAQTPGGRAGQPQQGRGQQPAGSAAPGAATAGGIIGVTSKSTDASIRLYKGRSHYNEWAFIYTPLTAAPGAGGAGAAVPGGRGRNGQPGQNQPTTPGGLPGRNGPFQPGPNGPAPGPGRNNLPNPFGAPGGGRR
jgi:type II secretory pathway pseudopilin PulG